MRACKVVPQGRKLKTLAINIKEMLIIGGWRGGGCFPHQFLLSFQGSEFSCLVLIFFRAFARLSFVFRLSPKQGI